MAAAVSGSMLAGVHYVWGQSGGSVSQKAFFLVAGVVFVVVALAHSLRILLGVAVVVYDIPVPMWASGIAAVISGYLGYEGFRLARKATP